MNTKTLGQRIKEIRKKKGITQTELANKLGKSLSTIQKYENDSIAITQNVLEEIVEALGTTKVQLIGLSKSEINNLLEDALSTQMQYLGYTIDFCYCEDTTGIEYKDNSNASYDKSGYKSGCWTPDGHKDCAACSLHNNAYYSITKDSRAYKIPIKELMDIRDQEIQFLQFLIEQKIKKLDLTS